LGPLETGDPVADPRKDRASTKAGAARANRRAFYDAFTPDDLKQALKRMYLVRFFEEGAEQAYMQGLTYGTMHLSIGQEATAIGATMALRLSDYITSTHRGHGHCIGKGADPRMMFAEFFGKEEGYCHGRGGSMHIADPASGNLGANGIVGGGIPIAVGAALAAKQQGRDDVAVCFFGDGASNEGSFHESLNMAALWKLPVIFICENNKYGMSVSTARSMAVTQVAQRAAGYAMPGVTVDGNTVEDVAEAVLEAIARARRGDGPSLIECMTYRTRGHSRSDRNRYRSKDEIEEWKGRDPIPRFAAALEAHGIASADDILKLEQDARTDIEAAIAFAMAGTDPLPADVTRDVHTAAP
jgi:pyruvate dehydrogenase E1 component alpha subunit